MALVPWAWKVIVPRHWIGELSVEHLSASRRPISALSKMLWERYGVASPLRKPNRLAIVVDARRGRAQPGHEARARWIADRRLAIGPLEHDASLCQPVHVGRHRVRMRTEEPDLMVQVVEGNEHHVRGVLRSGFRFVDRHGGFLERVPGNVVHSKRNCQRTS